MEKREFGHVIVSFRPPVEKWEKAWTKHNLAHPLLSDWKFDGFGIAVRDIDRAVDYYEPLDIAAFSLSLRWLAAPPLRTVIRALQ
jgi:hypothetical protein|tara:strand:+ start:7371 stop:7625 length:255 start_codon:yes stop_codon:yes gene_type:complete